MKYVVTFTKNIDLDIEVEAKNREEAREIAESLLSSTTSEERLKNEKFNFQSGYFEYAYTDEV